MSFRGARRGVIVATAALWLSNAAAFHVFGQAPAGQTDKKQGSSKAPQPPIKLPPVGPSQLPITPDAEKSKSSAAVVNHPHTDGSEDFMIGKMDVTVWRPKGSGPWPLVVFSHGFHGSSRQSAILMRSIADHGYLVAAPNHADSMRFAATNNAIAPPTTAFGRTAIWTENSYRDRLLDMQKVLSTIKASPVYSSLVQKDKVALIGHSLGGYTVLGMAGAWKGWKTEGIRAVIALSPYCAPFVQARTLAGISCPVMFQGGTVDLAITPSLRRKGGAFDAVSTPAVYVEFMRAGHFAWTDLNPEFQEDIAYYCNAFLDKMVKSDANADLTRKSPHVSDLRSHDGAKPTAK